MDRINQPEKSDHRDSAETKPSAGPESQPRPAAKPSRIDPRWAKETSAPEIVINGIV